MCCHVSTKYPYFICKIYKSTLLCHSWIGMLLQSCLIFKAVILKSILRQLYRTMPASTMLAGFPALEELRKWCFVAVEAIKLMVYKTCNDDAIAFIIFHTTHILADIRTQPGYPYDYHVGNQVKPGWLFVPVLKDFQQENLSPPSTVMKSPVHVSGTFSLFFQIAREFNYYTP